MEGEPLITRASLALLTMIFVGAFANTTASAKEVPKIPTPTQKATAAPLPTSTPSPTASPVPTEIPTSTPTSTATLTWPDIYATEAVEVTANHVVNRCLYYVNTTLGWLKQEDSDYHVLTVDDLPLILAVYANESACNPDVKSSAGAIGIGQVIPKPFYGSCLHQTPCNIYWSQWILDRAIEKHGLHRGLSAYNCSLEGIDNDMCGPTGGTHYADIVLEFWLPRFLDNLGVKYDLDKFD